MNRERAKKLLPVIQAFVDGADIQHTPDRFIRWEDVDNPAWTFGTDYRIKPELREWEVSLDEHGWTLTIRQPGEGDCGNWIKVREIIND